jgi:hypothetical protein
MKKYMGVGMLCMSLMVSGRAMADNDNHGFVNKTCDVDYKIDSCDLAPTCDQPVNYDINKCDDKKHDKKDDKDCKKHDDKDKKHDKDCKDDHKGDCKDYSNCGPNAGCNTGDGGKDCGGDHGCPKPPCDPTPKTPVVPLPASSALGGVGLAALALTSWIKRRRASIA